MFVYFKISNSYEKYNYFRKMISKDRVQNIIHQICFSLYINFFSLFFIQFWVLKCFLFIFFFYFKNILRFLLKTETVHQTFNHCKISKRTETFLKITFTFLQIQVLKIAELLCSAALADFIFRDQCVSYHSATRSPPSPPPCVWHDFPLPWT